MAEPSSNGTLTRKQEALVEALADPNVKTMSAVAERAGVSRTHVYRVLQNATVSSLVDAKKAQHTDKARSVYRKGMGVLDRALDDNPTVQEAALATKVAADVIEKGIEKEEEHDPTELERYERRRKRTIRFAIRLGYRLALSQLEGARIMETEKSVEDTGFSGSVSDNVQYVNPQFPPTDVSSIGDTGVVDAVLEDGSTVVDAVVEDGSGQPANDPSLPGLPPPEIAQIHQTPLKNLSENGSTQSKLCPDCSLRKPYVEFYKNKASRDGLQAYCKPCHKARMRRGKP